MRRWLVPPAATASVLVTALALLSSFAVLDSRLGTLPAALVTAVVAVTLTALLWLASRPLLTWVAAPRLHACRDELARVLAALPPTTDTSGMADCIVTVCGRFLPGRPLALLLPEARDERLVPMALGGPRSEALEGLALPRQSDVARALTREGRPLLVTRWLAGPDGSETPGERDTLVPLRVRGELRGVLVVGSDAANRGLSRGDTQLVHALCQQAAGALESAHLYGSLRAAFAELEVAQRELLALQRATTAAQSSLQLREVLRTLCNGVIEGMDYDQAIVYLVDPATKAVVPAGAAGRPAAPTLRARALTADGRPLRLDPHRPLSPALLQLREDVVISHDFAESIVPCLVDGAGPPLMAEGCTVVTLPLVAHGDIVGGMALVTGRRTPTERELDSLRGFAAQAALAIVNARLYEDLRNAYNDIRIAQDQLLHHERLRALGELASSVAHDFNNILLAILTHAQLAQRQTDEPAVRHALGVIEQAALDGAEVVRRVQTMARNDSADAQEVADLNVIVRQSMEFAQPVWKALETQGAPISARLETGPPARIAGTPSELREVMVNLLMNAIQAMPEGGLLAVRTFLRDGYAWAEVRDSGVGMTEDVRRRVFEPFFTTKGPSGSGLGMSIVASIVERHGGVIEIDSEAGRGTTVIVGFPLSSSVEAAPARAPAAAPAHEPQQVLVVDADARARAALTMALEELGHSVSAVGEAREALRTFIDGDYGVVFIDRSAGPLAGREVAGAVKKLAPSVEVILITGCGEPPEATDRIGDDVDQVLTKPFTLDQIAAVLERVGRRQVSAATA